MINKKLFALTLVASSVIAAGCSSDDDDEDDDFNPGTTSGDLVDETSDAVTAGPDATDVNGDGSLNDDDDFNNDNIIDLQDVDDFDAANPDGTDGGMTDNGTGTDTDTMPTAAVLPAGDDYDPEAQTPPASLNLAELATAADLTQLVQNVGGCDFADQLSNPEARLTVFAPNDEAFGDQAVTDALGAGADVCDVIAGHILVDTVATAADLESQVGTSATTLAGTTIAIGTGDDDTDDTDVDTDDTDTDDTDDSDGGTLTVGGSTIVLADQFATNGVAHVIDTVILPTADDTGDGTGEDPDGTGTGTGEIGPVVTAINNAGNTDFVQLANNTVGSPSFEDNAWTVFAPTNDAIDDGVLTADAATQNAVAQNHIAVNSGALDEDALSALSEITTNGNNTYPVAVDGDTITVNGFPVTFITAGEGGSAVYSIDGVLP